MIYVHLLKAAGNREILTSIRYTVLPRQEVVKRFSIQELSGGLLAKIFYGSSLQRFSSGLLCKDFLRAFFAKVFCRLLCKALLQVSFTKSFGWSSVECPFAVFYKAFQRYVTFSLTGSLDLPDRTMRLSCPKKQSNLAFEGWISAKNW